MTGEPVMNMRIGPLVLDGRWGPGNRWSNSNIRISVLWTVLRMLESKDHLFIDESCGALDLT